MDAETKLADVDPLDYVWVVELQGTYLKCYDEPFDAAPLIGAIKTGEARGERRGHEWFVAERDFWVFVTGARGVRGLNTAGKGSLPRARPAATSSGTVTAVAPLPLPGDGEDEFISAVAKRLFGDDEGNIEMDAPPDALANAHRRARARATTKGRACMSLEECFGLWHRSGGRCELTGVPFDAGPDAGHQPNSVSIDRLDNTLGYEQENCRLVTAQVNRALYVHDDDAFAAMCHAYVAKHPTPPC